MVPSDWQEDELINVLEKIIDYRGQSVPKAESGVPLITARNVRFGYLDFGSEEFIDESQFEKWSTRGTPKRGDILFTTEAPLGMACRFPESGTYGVGQRTVTLRTIPRLSSEFLLYFLLSERGQRLIDIRSSGSTAKGIKSSELKKVKILHPVCVDEQCKIAKVLFTWDNAISTTERLIDNSKQQKKALMQQLLTGKKRLLDDSGKPFEGEWEEVKLGDVCSKVTDGAHHSPQSVDVGYPMFSVKDMKSTGFTENTARHISEHDFQALVKQNCKPETNDILIAKDGSILKYCFVVKEEIQGVILSSIALLRPKLNKISPHFIAQYFSQESVRFFVGKALTSGSGVPRIILKDFKGILIRIPSLYEQNKIADVLANADQEIGLLEQQLADLKQEKKALMQQLLTGKRRVKLN